MPPRKRKPVYSILSALIILGATAGLAYSLATMDYEWSFGFLGEYFWHSGVIETDGYGNEYQGRGGPGLLLQGLWGTLRISFFSICLGIVWGVALGLILTLREPVSAFTARLVVDLFRNTPVLVQLYVAYFVVGTAFGIEAEAAGILTLGLFCGAYIAELTRVQLEVFDKGQLDAARSLGFSLWQTASHVVIPQVVRRMLPALVNQLVSLVKDSSLVSVISLMELTKAGLNIVSLTFRSFETWFVIAAMYFVINQALSTFGRKLERRLAKGEEVTHG